jgi:DNA-nicking Smr family endonuclease
MGKQKDDSDAELWARIARSAAPLKSKKKNRVTPAVPLPPVKPSLPKKNSAAQAAPKPAAKPPAKVAPPPPRDGALDRTTARKLETGRLAVEARLDLHGMRQREAHAALKRFLKFAQGKGYRHVLVITGKGAEQEPRASFYEEDERGVLRSAVPHWLGASELAPLVVSFSEAPRRLGGHGALYVRLRKAQR